MESDGAPRPGAAALVGQINALRANDFRRRQKAAERMLHQQGITFRVYDDKKGAEKMFPFDILPRIVISQDWEILEKGLKQRITALNLFIHDIYHDQKILKDNIIPKSIIFSSECYLKHYIGLPKAK